MNRRTTWGLVSLAVALFAFILLVERHTQPTSRVPDPMPPLVSLRALEVTNLQIRVTNRLALRMDKTNGGWHLTLPLLYPAQTDRIENLLKILENLRSHKLITLAELTAKNRTVAEFGLDVPQLTLTLQHDGRRTELLFGSRTPIGDQVYAQLPPSPDIFVVPADLLARLPADPNDWRDTSLLHLKGLFLDRLEVRAPNRGFALVLDATNKVFQLSKPTPARADGSKVEALLQKIAVGQIVRFVADGPVADLEPYGLHAPAAELVLGHGTNDLVVVQFGNSPSTDPGLVYARPSQHRNVALVPRALLDALQTSHMDLRDRHLLTFPFENVQAIEVVGPEAFAVQRQTSGAWQINSAPPMPADTALVGEWLERLSRLEGTVEKDVVSDFAPYGLTQPARQFLLKSALTNASGVVTNVVLAQLDLGGRQAGKIFARRPDETSVYLVPLDEVEALPAAAWQLRDRRVFRFTTNQVANITIRQHGYERKLLRSPGGNWSLAPGSEGVFNTFAVEEMTYRLSELRAVAWVDRGDDRRAHYGFTSQGYRLALELRNGDKPTHLMLEFGDRAPSLAPYALTTIDGQAWIFEFPIALFYELLRNLSNPPSPKTASRP